MEGGWADDTYAGHNRHEFAPCFGVILRDVLGGNFDVLLEGHIADDAFCGKLGELLCSGVPHGGRGACVKEEEEPVQPVR